MISDTSISANTSTPLSTTLLLDPYSAQMKLRFASLPTGCLLSSLVKTSCQDRKKNNRKRTQRKRMARAMCLASNVDTNLLRSQLDQLHSEAETTRRKANNARFRLLRLSEAAEKLRWQAARNLQIGKENDARELLLQKKKVMEALEKSKGRVELLDELAAKLNEAISIKEAQLVENVTSDIESGRDDGESPVRIVSPMQENGERLHDYNSVVVNNFDVGKDEEWIHNVNNEAKMFSDSDAEDAPGAESLSIENKASLLSSFSGVSSYIDFWENLDQKLCKIEEELVTILELPTMLLENQERPNNSRVKQLSEILENIRATRVRVQSYMQETLETN